jgi:hypothetical protein
VRHRALRHHAEGIFLCEKIFGTSIVNSDGREVPVRLIGVQHVLEDLGRIPAASDWLREITLQPWMAARSQLQSPEPAVDTPSAGSRNGVRQALLPTRSVIVPGLWWRHPAHRIHHRAGSDPEDPDPPRRTTRTSARLSRPRATRRLGRARAGPRRPGTLSGGARRAARHRYPQPLTAFHATVRTTRKKSSFKTGLRRREKSGLECGRDKPRPNCRSPKQRKLLCAWLLTSLFLSCSLIEDARIRIRYGVVKRRERAIPVRF